MQYKYTSKQAFLIIYLICILSFIYFSLGRSPRVSHLISRQKSVGTTDLDGRSQQAFQNPKYFLKQALLQAFL